MAGGGWQVEVVQNWALLWGLLVMDAHYLGSLLGPLHDPICLGGVLGRIVWDSCPHGAEEVSSSGRP